MQTSMGVRSTDQDVRMDLNASGQIHENNMLNWSSAVAIHNNGDGVMEFDTALTGSYVDVYKHAREPFIPQQASASFSAHDSRNRSLSGDSMSILWLGKGIERKSVRVGGHLRWASLEEEEEEALNCTWSNTSASACQSVSHSSVTDCRICRPGVEQGKSLRSREVESALFTDSFTCTYTSAFQLGAAVTSLEAWGQLDLMSSRLHQKICTLLETDNSQVPSNSSYILQPPTWSYGLLIRVIALERK
eukprot:767554-Hanusia_phi.AAC.7